MSRGARLTAMLWLVSALFLGIPPASAQVYLEDFYTTTFRDLGTSAWWDTGSGVLKLWPFQTMYRGSLNTPGNAMDVAIDGDLAFVADSDAGVRIIDVSNPSAPVAISSINPNTGNAWSVVVNGNWLYVSMGQAVHCIDVSDPSNPVLAHTWEAPATAYGLAISGHYLCVACATAGLQILEIGDPPNMWLRGLCDTPGSAIDVAAAYPNAYVADRSGGLQVVGIQNPLYPTIVGSWDSPGDAWGIDVAGTYAYLGDAGSGLQIIDVSDRTAPFLRSHCNTGGSARGVVACEDFVYVANYGNVAIVDVEDPVNPFLRGTYTTPGVASNVAPAGPTLYIADGTAGGLQVCWIADFPGITAGGEFDQPGYGTCVARFDNYAFVGADGHHHLQILDLHDPNQPTWLGEYSPYYNPQRLAIDGNTLYMTLSSGNTLKALNISDPLGMYTFALSTATVEICTALAASADRVYLLGKLDSWERGLFILELAYGAYETRGYFYLGVDGLYPANMALRGEVVFVPYESASFPGYLYVVDVSDPTSPAQLSRTAVDEPRCVAVAGEQAYVGTETGVHVYDISDLTVAPYPELDFFSLGGVRDIKIEGDLALVTSTNSFSLLNVVDPTAISSIAYQPLPGPELVGAVYDGDFVHLLDTEVRLHALGIMQRRYDRFHDQGLSTVFATTSDPVVAVSLATVHLGNVSWEISADAGAHWQAVTADGAWNNVITPGNQLRWRSQHEYTSPNTNPSCSLLQIWWSEETTGVPAISPGSSHLVIADPRPNPSATDITFEYASPRDADVRLRVLDVTGRVVTSITAPTSGAGQSSRLCWNGRDANGVLLPSGRYFVELDDGKERATASFTILR